MGGLKSDTHTSPPSVPTAFRSFAFQGTNAHAILSTQMAVCPAYSSSASRVSFCSRHWFAPECHPLLRSASTDGIGASFEIRVAPVASSLFDHRVLGRALFPGAGYLETALAASRSLLGDGEPSLFAATAASIPVPMFLPELDPGLGGLSEATAFLRLRAESFEVVPGSGHRLVHAIGSFGFLFLPFRPAEVQPSAVAESTGTVISPGPCCIADGKRCCPYFRSPSMSGLFALPFSSC